MCCKCGGRRGPSSLLDDLWTLELRLMRSGVISAGIQESYIKNGLIFLQMYDEAVPFQLS